jgi:predicted DNA-binding antitoxin AbrB/MazE fold protein
MTPLVVEATYEGGMLKPAQPLPLKEHDRVRLTVEALSAAKATEPLNLANWLAAIEAETGLVDGPEDWAAHHDHYLYGAPKGHMDHGG